MEECNATLKLYSLPPLIESTFNKLWTEVDPNCDIQSGTRLSHCDLCLLYRKKVIEATTRPERDKWRQKRQEHLDTVRGERHVYYMNKIRGGFVDEATGTKPFLSIIIDGWDQCSSVIPQYGSKHATEDGLGLKCSGAIVHHQGRPGSSSPHMYRAFFSYDHAATTNLNTECLRRVLSELCGGDFTKLTAKTLYLQLDNTSKDNKNNYLLRSVVTRRILLLILANFVSH